VNRSILHKFALTLVGATVVLSGCVYRMDIQQGNYLDGRAIAQLQDGMTRSQVRYLLGTPMVQDVFDTERWDYLYYLRKGRWKRPQEGHLIVWFKDEKVAKIERNNVPDTPLDMPGAGAPIAKFPKM
jgi:outer membrane protein assembly factor BamE